MRLTSLGLLVGLTTPAVAADTAPPENPVYRVLLADGFRVGAEVVRFPEPTLADGRDADACRAVLRQVAGDDRAAKELVRDSVTAPFILRTRDVRAEGAIIRVVDVWFVVRGTVAGVDLDATLRPGESKMAEAGNMRFTTRLAPDTALQARSVARLPDAPDRREWFAEVSGTLLDRIAVDVTNRTVLTRSAGSITIAAQADPRFDAGDPPRNGWRAIAKSGPPDQAPLLPYAGGAGYAKITPLASEPGALFVEGHFAFAEPLGWFDGNPILRSKIGVIVQDQVRSLRRQWKR